MTYVRSSPSDRFQSFQLRSSDDQFLTFALRSRIKTQASYKSPLAGLRIVIKDNIHLKGIKTSVGNRAFYDTYPPRKESAQCIQKLLDRGVVVVGKAKMNSFGNWEEPTEYIDYQAPWNPRGDRYQSTGGSSSGSASAIAAYDWLDIAIGTDSNLMALFPCIRWVDFQLTYFHHSVGKCNEACTLVWVLWSSPQRRDGLWRRR